jgi:hypothetical protein
MQLSRRGLILATHRAEQYYRLRIIDWDAPFGPAIGVAM